MRFRLQRACSFTLIELLVVIAIIGLLAGLLLAAAGGVRNQAARSQAKTDIAALEVGLTRYQLDFGAYPTPTNNISTSGGQYPLNPSNYVASSQMLFSNLMGRTLFTNIPAAGLKPYLDPKPTMVQTNQNPNFFRDPWGYAYGYYWDGTNSLFGKATPDLWSTGNQNGSGTQTNRAKWICNWIN